jgi:sugar/nucleoside kinase (ribokinase family)
MSIAAAVAGQPLAVALRWGNDAAALTISRAAGSRGRTAVMALVQSNRA